MKKKQGREVRNRRGRSEIRREDEGSAKKRRIEIYLSRRWKREAKRRQIGDSRNVAMKKQERERQR